MSGTLSFASIPPNLRVPLAYFEFDNSEAGVTQANQRTLIVGQCTTAVPAIPTFVPSAEAAQSLFGIASQLSRMISAYRMNDPVGELWAVPLQDATGSTAGGWTIALIGAATSAGALSWYVGGQKIAVPVTSGMTAAQMAAATVAAFNAIPSLPFVSTVSGSANVVMTAVNKGSLGSTVPVTLNYLGTLSGEAIPAGVGASISPIYGAGDADLSFLAAALGSEDWDFIIAPTANATQTGQLTALMNNTSGRWSYSTQHFGHVFTGSLTSAASLLTLGDSLNDPHLTMWGVPAASPMSLADVIAMRTGAIVASLKADPARPVQTLPVIGELATPPAGRFSFANRQALLSNGIALVSENRDNSVQILRCVTTYQTNSFGVADQSYLDVETMFTLAAVTRQLKNAVQTKFPRSKLADDGTAFGPGQPVVTPNIIKAEIIAQYQSMERAGLVEDADLMAKATIVERNANDPSRVDVLWAPYLVSGLRIFAAINQFRLAAA